MKYFLKALAFTLQLSSLDSLCRVKMKNFGILLRFQNMIGLATTITQLQEDLCFVPCQKTFLGT